MTPLYLDIETLPAEMDAQQIADLAARDVPKNLRDPAKIDEWIATNADDRHRRTALDPMRGRMLMLAFAVGDGPVESCYLDNPNDPTPILDALAGAVARIDGAPVFVGHNIAGFDIPYLRYAALRLRHPVARVFPATRYSSMVADTMSMWCGTNTRADYVKLADIAAFLGLGGKVGGIDGSQVYDAWLAGRHDEVRAYGCGDVALVRDVYRVLVFDFTNPTTKE